MAEAGPKWPGPVTFDDEEPKKGFARLSLSIPKLTVSKAFLGKAEPKNGTVREEYTKQSVTIHITVNEGGTSTVYEYTKRLPEDIDPEKCTHKVKAGQVIVILCKLEPVSWGGHAKYLIKKE